MTKKDPLFWDKFQISTHITYFCDVAIEKGKEKLFEMRWKKAWKKIKDSLSKTRKQAFATYFQRFKKENDDTFCTKKLAILFISKKVGYGVFAKVSIPPYTTLGHYAGILRLDREIDPENDSSFSFGDFPLFSIDAQTAGNWARFMNHSDLRQPKTNVIAWEYYTRSKPYIVFTAGAKGIKKGEQLLYSYGERYWYEKKFTRF